MFEVCAAFSYSGYWLFMAYFCLDFEETAAPHTVVHLVSGKMQSNELAILEGGVAEELNREFHVLACGIICTIPTLGFGDPLNVSSLDRPARPHSYTL